MLFLYKILYVIVLWIKKRRNPKQPNRVSRGSPVKIPLQVHKIHVFWRGSTGEISFAETKYHVIGFASTRGHEKQPTAIDFKVAQFRGKPAWRWRTSCSRVELPDPSQNFGCLTIYCVFSDCAWGALGNIAPLWLFEAYPRKIILINTSLSLVVISSAFTYLWFSSTHSVQIAVALFRYSKAGSICQYFVSFRTVFKVTPTSQNRSGNVSTRITH